MIKYISYLLNRIDNDKEVAKWIREFGSYKGPFAVLKLSGASVQSHLQDLCDDIAILSKLDLDIPIVYGWGNALTKKLDNNHIESIIDPRTGVRVTKKQDIPFLEEVAQEQGELIFDNLKSQGIASKIIYGIFSAKRKNLTGYDKHYTGDFVSVNTIPIIECLRSGIIPLIPPLGYTLDGELMNINGDNASRGLVLSLKPKRYIMITNPGGILDQEGQLINKITLSKDYHNLVNGIVFDGMKVKLDEVKDTMYSTPDNYNLEIQIAHPMNILEELFTDKGKGTYISR